MVTGERQAARIRGLYLKTILRHDVDFFDTETNTGEVVGRMSGDTILIQDATGEKVLYCCINNIKIHNWPKFSLSYIHTMHLNVFLAIKEYVCLYRLENFAASINIHWGIFLQHFSKGGFLPLSCYPQFPFLQHLVVLCPSSYPRQHPVDKMLMQMQQTQLNKQLVQ